ncbi:MAG: Na+/H+ antiporter subunit D [Hyphomicrobiales bacterium]|nr:MAG: Na+/H+ antiporter subunit D [Hyphomicrobiales bacterium]
MAAESHAVDVSHAMVTEAVALGDWLVILPMVICILGGAVTLMLRKKTSFQPWLAIFLLTLLVAVDVGLLLRVLEKGPVTMVMGRWLPPFGIAFTVDTVGALLALTSAVIGLVAAIYARADIGTLSRRYGFYPLLLLLLAGVSGSFLTGDIFNLYVWFELMLISSFGLLILGSSRMQLDGAVKYAVLNLIATTLFLIATGYLYGLLGTLNMADITVKLRSLPDGAPIGTIATLYCVAFAMKAAAFPTNFWLPASYHTPRIVVSAIFGGLLTKVGVYALLRTLVMLMPESRVDLAGLLVWIAALTMLSAVLAALAQSDVRRTLGYLVISGIGSMLVGIALGTPEAIGGTIFYAIHSMLVMTGLYLVIGIVIRVGGAHDLAGLGGLYGNRPYLAALFLILAFAIAGLPPFSGFWPKVILVRASLDTGHTWLATAILVTGFLTSLAVGRLWLHVFWRGGPLGTPDGAQSTMTMSMAGTGTKLSVYVPVTVFVAAAVVIGLMPEPVMKMAMDGAAVFVDPTAYIGSVFPGGAQ